MGARSIRTGLTGPIGGGGSDCVDEYAVWSRSPEAARTAGPSGSARMTHLGAVVADTGSAEWGGARAPPEESAGLCAGSG